MSKWCGIVGLLVWIGGVAAIAMLMRRDVITEPVDLRLVDGTLIHGTLYRPNTDHTDLAAAVVIHGTALSHQSCVPGFAIPLAREDFLTLAIDLRGHGHSGGALPRRALEGDPTAVGQDDYPEIDAAIDFLKQHPLYIKQHPWIRSECFVLVGHSRGGLAAASVGYQRGDVDGVISVGVAPQTCDVSRPRNFLIVTGTGDRLFPRAKCIESISRATNGAVREPYKPFGDFSTGTARRLYMVGGNNHLNELANPSMTHHVVDWATSSVFFHLDPIPRAWLPGLMAAVLAATVGGFLACTGISSRLAGVWLELPSMTRRPLRVARLAVLFVVLAALVPGVAAGERLLEVGPVYFAGPCVVLLASAGIASMALAKAGGTGVPPVRDRRDACPTDLLRGLLLGLVTLLFTFAWIGVPWGQTWADLIPSPPRRLLLGIILFSLLFPSSLGLAFGLLRLAGRLRFAPALLWLALPLSLWASQMLLASRRWPLFAIPVALLAAGFLISSPLWLVPPRRGLSLARAVTHAAATAWLLACHVPFVE
jgi:pimeloyl-ACP methyl ester carboxylesterase